jgi:hypothetical protein
MTEKELDPHCWYSEVDCVIFVDKSLLINHYNIEVGFLPAHSNPMIHDMALEKIEMFFNLLMKNSVIVKKSDYDTEFPIMLTNNILMIPETLNDQTVGAAIFSKLIAIVGNELEIVHIKISSELGRGIRYTIFEDSPELTELLPSKKDWWKDTKIKFNPWWMRSDTATYDRLINRDEIYEGEFVWDEYFKEELESIRKSQEAEAIAKGKFKIINGGKDEDKQSK